VAKSTEQRAPEETTDEPRVARRRFLRRGAIAAAAAAAGTTAVAGRAGAADNDSILIGNANNAHNTGTTTTTLSSSQFVVSNGNSSLSLVGSHSTTDAIGIEGRSTGGAQMRLAPNALNLLNDTTHNFTAGSLVADTNDILWYVYANGTGQNAGLHPISITGAFFPFSPPIRLYDSRPDEPPFNVTKGALSAFIGQERTINILVPNAQAVAVLLNVTVVDTTGQGFLALFAADQNWDPQHPFSSTNWYTNGQITANGVATAVEFSSGNIKVHAGGNGTTHLVIDITGIWII